MPYVNLIDYLRANQGAARAMGQRLTSSLEPKRAAAASALGSLDPGNRSGEWGTADTGGARAEEAVAAYGGAYDRLMGSLGQRQAALGPGATARDAWLAGTGAPEKAQFDVAGAKAAHEKKRADYLEAGRKREAENYRRAHPYEGVAPFLW